ncbi:HIT family protein [Criblamydia sequanensis]|uniref:Histidine triad (HIT) protein n=1 Tax=Candidatus Criblamydia sequanensis CRIB-18 TaxID=1437425 RepID=A0A090D0R9_9BACT|nr:HIT family protein [Criblamydia sequanensis]CDR34931.1 Histidine triad (HIT) protein [Criblamydia sequanensis CRIB-18]
MRKIKFCFAVSLILLSFFIWNLFSLKPLNLRDCPFCSEKVLEGQKFYEDDLVIGLLTHKPIYKGHVLIIPKRHAEQFGELTETEISRIGALIKKVDKAVKSNYHTASYVLLQKNGYEAGQSVPHVHFHYIPREKGASSSLEFIISMVGAVIKKPLPKEEMREVVIALKKELESS